MIYDVAVVGAGPAGSFAAYLLGRAGKKVLLIDKNKDPVRKVCGEYLCPRGVALINGSGAGTALRESLPINGMKMVTPRGTTVHSSFPLQASGRAVNRKIFDNHLLELAKSQGVELRLGVTVGDLRRAEHGWTLATNRGDFSASFVIGADGRGSRISKIFDNDRENKDRRVAVHCFVNSERDNDRFGEMHMFADSSYIGVDPTGTREVNLSLVANAQTIQSLGGPARALFHYINLSTDLQRRFGVELVNTPVTTAYPIQHQTNSVVPGEGVALVGDAAGFVDPLTGEGIFNALLSSQLLSQALIEQPERALPRYRRSYVKHLRGKIRLNRVFQWLLRKPWLIERIAKFLLRKEQRADTFIGIVGNVYSPLSGILRMLS